MKEKCWTNIGHFFAINVIHFRMSVRGLTYFEQHFLFSSRIFQFLIRTRPNQNFNEQLFLFYAVIVYMLPIILHQFYQLYMFDTKLQSIMKLFELMIPALYFLYCYYKMSISLTTMKLLFAHIKLDYELMTDEEEFEIIEKYTKQTKLYVYFLIVLFYLHLILMTSPSIVSVLWYIFGISDDVTLPISMNNVLHIGFLYYILLIYQIFASFAIVTIGSVCYSSYWVLIQHVCSQFSVMIWKIRRAFKTDEGHTQNTWLNVTPQEECNWMIDIIKFYTRITKFVDVINKFYKIIYLIAVIIALLLIIFNFLYIFELFSVLLNVKEIIEGFVYMATFLFISYISFYVGQLLINHSNDAFEELCNIPFYNLSVRTQKLLLFLLTRTIKPIELSIGGIFVASHVVYAGLIQKAFSFATVYYSTLQT